MLKLETLLSPLQIGTMTVRNRTFMAPMSLGYKVEDGIASEATQRYWLERAKGGVGCIITDVLSVDPHVPYNGPTMNFGSEHAISAYKEFTDKIHAHGAKIIPQVSHPGPESVSCFMGITPVAASSYINDHGFQTRALELDEIPTIIQQYATTAKQCREAGFDGIELHAAHAYMLLGSFLSPLRNKRTDHYGGSLMNRARLLFEVIEAIKKEAGEDFPIIIRLAGSEKVAGGNNVDDILAILPYLEKLGVDGIEVSGGTQYEACNKIIACHGERDGLNTPQSAAIKAKANIPVIVVGRILDPRYAEFVLDNNKADGVVLGRALLSDPQWVNKAAEGDFEGIAPCASCGIGCIGEQTKRRPATCVINPALGREAEFEFEVTDKAKDVLIIGGGAAGMAAARAAALKGHNVTLAEKSNQLGGQLNLACIPPHKQDLAKWVTYLNNQLERLNVNIELNTFANEEYINSKNADEVIISTGATYANPPIKGADQDHVIQAWDLISNEKMITTGNVLVIGGGMVGLETAELLYHRARGSMNVTIAEMLPEAGADLIPNNKIPMLKRLAEDGATILTNTVVTSINDTSVTIETDNIESQLQGITHVVLACGAKSENTLFNALKDNLPNAKLIGDAMTPAQALEAIREGTTLGISL